MGSCKQNGGWAGVEEEPSEVKIDVSKLVEQIQSKNINGDGAGESSYGVEETFGNRNQQRGGEATQRRGDIVFDQPEKRTFKELAASAGKKLFGNSSSD